MAATAKKLPIRMAHQASTPRIGWARKTIRARKNTSKAARKMRRARSIAGSRSAPWMRRAAIRPTATKATPWRIV